MDFEWWTEINKKKYINPQRIMNIRSGDDNLIKLLNEKYAIIL